MTIEIIFSLFDPIFLSFVSHAALPCDLITLVKGNFWFLLIRNFLLRFFFGFLC